MTRPLVLALSGGAVARERFIRRLERESARSESLAAVGRLAAMVAHEVRNPLNAISVGVQRLEREVVPEGKHPQEMAGLTRIIRSEIDRLDRWNCR